MDTELDRVVAAVAGYYWLRPAHLQLKTKHKIVKLARRVASYHAMDRTELPATHIAVPLAISSTTVYRAGRRIRAGVKDEETTREVLDALAIGRALVAR